MNRLPDTLYQMPQTARTTMTRAQLRETLLATDGRVFACGTQWAICSKHIGAGVYEITLAPTRKGGAK